MIAANPRTLGPDQAALALDESGLHRKAILRLCVRHDAPRFTSEADDGESGKGKRRNFRRRDARSSEQPAGEEEQRDVPTIGRVRAKQCGP